MYEKYTMRRALLRHMRAVPSPYVQAPHFTRMLVRSRALIASTVVGLLLVSTTVSYAASVALPGDVLYPIKVSINEPVRVLLARTPEAQAQVHVAIAAERLTEAEQLALRGDLSERKTVFLSKEALQNINRALATVVVLKNTDADRADELRNKIDATINAHAIVLSAIAKQYEHQHATTSVQLAAISAQVSSETRDDEDSAQQSSPIISMGLSTEATTSLLMRASVPKQGVGGKQTETQAYISARRAKAFQEIADLQSKLDGEDSEARQRAIRANDAAARGDSLLSAGDVSGALRAYARADQSANEGQQLVLLENKLKITVNAQKTNRATSTSTATTTSEGSDSTSLDPKHGPQASIEEGVLPVPQLGGE